MRRLTSQCVSLNCDPVSDSVGRLTSVWTPVHGLRLHAMTTAEALSANALTIVLVHRVAASSRYLVPLAEHLARQAHVYLPDLPGYGLSDRPGDRDLPVPELADAPVAWMDRTGQASPHLIGNSLGCQVIADLAIRHPDRIGRLVFKGPTVDPGARSAWRQILRWLAVVPLHQALADQSSRLGAKAPRRVPSQARMPPSTSLRHAAV